MKPDLRQLQEAIQGVMLDLGVSKAMLYKASAGQRVKARGKISAKTAGRILYAIDRVEFVRHQQKEIEHRREVTQAKEQARERPEPQIETEPQQT